MGRERDILREIVGEGGFAEARRNFWAYCRTINPRFFREDRPHLRRLAEALQALMERRLVGPDGGACRKLIVNLPPRMGKSYTLSLFNQWALGRNPEERIITVSYNELLAERFSRAVRNGISATAPAGAGGFSPTCFPGCGSKRRRGFQPLGAGGTADELPCRRVRRNDHRRWLLHRIIDDPVKTIWRHEPGRAGRAVFLVQRYVFLPARGGAAQIIVMTRWAVGDLAGRLTEREPSGWHVLRMPACLDEARREMLCPELLSWERWQEILRTTSQEIALANYQQQPSTSQGDCTTTFPLSGSSAPPGRRSGV